MERWANVGLMLTQRRRRWVNIKPTLAKRILFAGKLVEKYVFHAQKHLFSDCPNWQTVKVAPVITTCPGAVADLNILIASIN